MNKHEHIEWEILNIIEQEMFRHKMPVNSGRVCHDATRRISSLIKEHYDINDKPFESDELYRGPTWDKLCEERIGKEAYKLFVEQMDQAK